MRKLTPVLLTVLLGAFITSLWLRQDSAAKSTSSTTASSPTGASATTPAGKPAPAKPVPLARTLRTVALGWEFLAPGVIANDGADAKPSAFKTAGLDVGFANAATIDELEAALARGGGEATGADIAILPLSTYVASYERMRALSLEIVFVVGWSRGREALYGSTPSALARLPATSEVKLAATSGQPETFLALFLLDLAGVAPSRVELVDWGSAPLTATFRAGKQRTSGKLLFTSADTPHLLPIVAVAPRGFITAHGPQLTSWARVWLEGVARLGTDVPAGARMVAAQPGAPAVVGIIEALGQIEFATLRENAVAVGLAGRGTLTLDDIFKTSWRIWRDAGVLATPPPELVPLHSGVVASLARGQLPPEPARPTAAARDDKRPEVLLVVRGPEGKVDVDAWITRVGLLAAVFDRLSLRVSIKDDPKSAQLVVDGARERFNLRSQQLVVGKRRAVSAIEVLAAR